MTPSSPNTAQTTPRQDAELKPCPFCGSPPVYAPANPEDQGDAWSRLSCVNADCPAKPVVTVRDDDRDFHVREVGRLWNTRAALSPAPEAGEKGLITDLTHARAYRDGLRAGFRMGEGSEAERYEAALSKIHAEITEAAFQPPATSSAKVPSSLEDALRGIINFIRAEEPLTESRAAILGSLLDQADAALTPVSA